ncbi:cysteine dioxygenase [Fusarium pseudocircinatum]|uniref:Cysteine dioxygenase n=1 Tax=Fusarium pseudocircinatum TaxID=56676 RepID=A0A8H5LB51_9HYPO|nr:cysteine dioxygenase [Fusarium pseudocircinatum]
MADPSHFADPFWEPQDQIPVELDAQPQVSPFKPANLLSSISPSWKTTPVGIDFAVGGLGTIAAKADSPKESVTFTIRPEKRKEQPTLKLEITETNCVLSKKEKDADKFVAYKEKLTFEPGEERNKFYDVVMFPKGKRSALLDTLTKRATYWISVDRSNARIRYGQSLINNSMTFMEIQFEKEKAAWMDHLVSTEVEQDGSPISNEDIKYKPQPVTVDLPPVVIPESEMTLEILENMTAMTFANLPKACQKLYHNISGAKITARPEKFKDLPEAIDESCRDENKYCGDILKRKDTFGDPLETYLRITVGDNLADSPGIPYVMEIWPPGHKSPIHQHGDASAVIRVLYGKIQVSWFDKVEEGSPSQLIGNPVVLEEGKVTWLGKDQYQVHQLENTSDKVCITLQCYQFDDDDKVHDEAFYWKDEEGHRRKFIPNSDSAYGLFVQKVKDEWEKTHRT